MGVRWRKTLPRLRKSIRLELKLSTCAKLARLARVDREGKRESIVAVVERLIDEANELPADTKKTCT